jgi:Asp-tRNA(Asn)/Glu-tRNA(Gln) amidotransferase A subunit family amidase
MISLSDLKRRIDAGELSPDLALAQSLDTIEAQEKTIGAFVRRSTNPRAAGEGPLRGIAVGIKDIIDTADLPTEMGSSIYRGWQPRADASVVMMLKRAGATIAGKTTTTTFAALDPTATLNPRNHGHTPGGSSAGSAAAVAAGMVPLALGTQTAGSVIRPASFCGVAAIKPSYRLLPTVGVKCYSWTLDTVGLFAAGVEDLAVALAAMTGRPELAQHAPTKPLRIGVVTQDFAGSVEAASDAALRIAAAAAEKAGAAVRLLKLPEIFTEAWQAQAIIQDFEVHRALAWEYQTHHDEIAPKLRAKMDETAGLAPSAHVEALATAERARAAFDSAASDLDVLLTYSAPGAAPKGLASTGDPRFNRLWTLLGVPCVNVTADVADGGLPVGVQIIARFGEDAKALAAARVVEDALRR